MGIVEEDPARGLVKYAKPVGVIASLVPVTNAGHTEVGNGIYSLKCKNAIIFAPHPAGKKTSIECVRLMREAVKMSAGRVKFEASGGVTQETVKAIEDITSDKNVLWDPSFTRDQGWVFCVDMAGKYEKAPADLQDMIAFAHGQGCDWLMFDCDANVVDELKTYDW